MRGTWLFIVNVLLYIHTCICVNLWPYVLMFLPSSLFSSRNVIFCGSVRAVRVYVTKQYEDNDDEEYTVSSHYNDVGSEEYTAEYIEPIMGMKIKC